MKQLILTKIVVLLLSTTLLYTCSLQHRCNWESCPTTWDCEETDSACYLIRTTHEEHSEWTEKQVERYLISSLKHSCNWEECPLLDSREDGTDYGLIQDIHQERPDWTYEQCEQILFTPTTAALDTCLYHAH